MKRAIYRTLFGFLTAICLLLLTILFIVLTKDDWYLFKVSDIVLTVMFFLTIPLYGLLCKHFGILAERNRHRNRIKNVMAITEK